MKKQITDESEWNEALKILRQSCLEQDYILIKEKNKILNQRIKILKDALIYCASFAHPTIVCDVARQALADSSKFTKNHKHKGTIK